ncbi:endo-1,4-beta-xylanase [Dactylosporangium sp. NPDC051541]|uniref:endo-1,4-beta-xylanase n=1 Tax=Dactylosporangium sp. NPDC051541 TaxID=3363977 RepID=UPI003799289E
MRRGLAGWTGRLIVGLLLCTSVVALPLPVLAQDVVAGFDFEDGTVQGWAARGGASVAAVAAAARTGTYGLRTSGRTQSWEGPSVQLAGRLLTGATYAISGYVRPADATAPAVLQLTMQRTPVGGSATYDFLTSASVAGSDWVELRAAYTVPSDSSELQLYVESGDATVAFDLDDVTITMTSAPPTGPPDQAGVATDFEDGTAQGWSSRFGVGQAAVSTADAHGGTHSLLTTGRTETWTGPSRSLLGRVSKGSRYTFDLWVKLAPGEASSALRLSMERSTGGAASYDQIVGDSPVTASGWTELRGTYTLAYDVDALSVYVESSSGTASFYLDDFVMTYVRPLPVQTDIPSLRDVLAPDFPIGTAIGRGQMIGEPAELLTRHFNSVTPGNALKWDATEPAEGQFQWAEADAEVDYAVAHGMKIRGHTLVWHAQAPDWIFKDADGADMTPTPPNKALLLQREERHIRAVMGRYKGKMYAWDVVNEAVDEYQPDGLRRSKWMQIAGLDFIRTAFRVAHEVDPAAKLYLNDYNTTQPNKRAALLRLVRQLRAEGLPIDGVGHQMHIDIEKPSIGDIEQTLRDFAAIGVDNQVTELDMSVYTNGSDKYTTVPADVLTEQGYRYRDLFNALRRQRANLSSVTFWGQSDDGSWLNAFPITRLNEPLPFDEQLQAKPAYWGIVDPGRLPRYTRGLVVPEGRPAPSEWALLPATTVLSRAGRSLAFSLRWEGRVLHVHAMVGDKTADRGDAVDITVGDRRVRVPRTGAPPSGIKASVHPDPAGYRIDADVPLPAPIAAGQPVPFDITLIDPTESAGWGAGRPGLLTLAAGVRHVDAIRGTPGIDGVADAAWSRAATISTGVQVIGSGGATASAKVLWDSGHVYLLVAVSDVNLDASSPNVWEQDAVEIFIDPDNAKTAGYADDDGQYRINYANAQSFGGNFSAYAIAGNLTSATRTVPGGYVVEAAIALPTATLCDGTLLGLDIQVNDADAGHRTAARTWNDPTGLAYTNTSRWGVTRLVNR